MPHYLPRISAYPIAGENSILTNGGVAIRIPAKEKPHKFLGKFAPEIRLNDHLGRPVSLHATIALGRPIVLYFFPLAGSPHCTKESCSFRDALRTSPIFNELNAIVIGISQDPISRQKRFVDEHHLGFRILHDPDRKVLDEWDVGHTMLGLIDARCTFIIDHQGFVRAMAEGVWDYQFHFNFAEKWLIRIEHELAGRKRFYFDHYDNELIAAGSSDGKNVRLMYGSPTAATGKGIGIAPRYGAASIRSSLDADAKQSGKLRRPKSKRNLKTWFAPKHHACDAFHEAPILESSKLKPAHHSLDDLALVASHRLRATRPQFQSGELKHIPHNVEQNDIPPVPSHRFHSRPSTPDSGHSSVHHFPNARRILEGSWGASSTESAGSNSTDRTSVCSSKGCHSHSQSLSHSLHSSSNVEHGFAGTIATGDSVFVRVQPAKLSSAAPKPVPGKRSSSLSLASKYEGNQKHTLSLPSYQRADDVPYDGKNVTNAEEDHDFHRTLRKPALPEAAYIFPSFSTSTHRLSNPVRATVERPFAESSRSRTTDSVMTRGSFGDVQRSRATSLISFIPDDVPRYTTSLLPRPSLRSACISSVDTVMPKRQSSASRSFSQDALRDTLDDGDNRDGVTTPTQAEGGDPISNDAARQVISSHAPRVTTQPRQMPSGLSLASDKSSQAYGCSSPRRALLSPRALPLRSPVPSYAPPPLPVPVPVPTTPIDAHLESRRGSANSYPSIGSAYDGSSRSSLSSDSAISIAESSGTFGGSPPDGHDHLPIAEMNSLHLPNDFL